MKLIDKKQNFVSDGIDKKAFKIKASAKAFDILSSKLYSRPIDAIVRELSTNAVDAHIMAGNSDKKYQVSLPSYNNPYYEIRDFGTGLTVDEVESIFTTVFESTKTSSNDVTGCLGLGSKSPFAYADSYNVTSYKDGMVYQFSCFKDEYGIPHVAQFSEESTTEPNGLKISIAISSSDCDLFVRAASRIYPYLLIKPEFVGGRTIDIEEIKYEEQDGWWGVCKNRPNDVDGLMVIMGGVAYPVANKIDTSDFNDVEQCLVNSNIDITLNIGDVDIEAGREGLQFTKRTQNIIRHKFRHIVKHFVDKVQADFSSCKTEWDVYCYSHDYVNSLGNNFIHHIFSSIKIEINGKKINPSTTNIHCGNQELYSFYNNGSTIKKSRCRYVRPTKKCVFINNDDSKAAYSKTRYYQENNPGIVVYYLDAPKDINAKDNLCKSLGIDKSLIIDCATLPKRPRNGVTTGSSGPKKKTAAAVKYVKNQSPQYSWKDSVVDVYTEVYYVPVDRYSPICDGKTVGVETVSEGLKCLNIIGATVPTEVYGFRKSLIDKINKDKKCKVINFYTFVKEQVEKFDNKENYTQKYVDYKCNNNVLTYREESILKKIDITNINPNSLIPRFVAQLNTVAAPKNPKDIVTIHTFLAMFSGFSEKTPKTDLTKAWGDIIIKYPLISVFDYYNVNSSQITEYINAIDCLKGV